ncbi:MAG: biopolymer transporter ExbD [Kofleriaceae bacterium]
MASASPYPDGDGDGGDAITDINVTPFVDVVLVLLVIFMVTARLIITRGVEGIEKPTSTAGAAIEGQVRVSVTADGRLFVGDLPFDDDAAATAEVRARVTAAGGGKVIISGDASAAYRGVMRAIGVVQAAGVDGIALENVAP